MAKAEGEDEEEPEDEDQAHRSKVLHQDCNDRAAGTKEARETIQHPQHQHHQQHERLSRQERPCKYQGLLLVSEESSIEKCKAGQHELHQCHANQHPGRVARVYGAGLCHFEAVVEINLL